MLSPFLFAPLCLETDLLDFKPVCNLLSMLSEYLCGGNWNQFLLKKKYWILKKVWNLFYYIQLFRHMRVRIWNIATTIQAAMKATNSSVPPWFPEVLRVNLIHLREALSVFFNWLLFHHHICDKIWHNLMTILHMMFVLIFKYNVNLLA